MSKTYPYVIRNSILYGLTDEYSLSKEEYYLLYSFFVTHSMCGTQSAKKKSFVDYGWGSNKIEDTSSGKAVPTALGNSLKAILEFKRQDSSFIFSGVFDLGSLFLNNQLCDGHYQNTIPNVLLLAARMAKTNIRNCFIVFVMDLRMANSF